MHIFLIMIWCVLCTASFVNGVLHTENGEFYIKMPQWKNIVELNTIESNKALKAYWGALHCVRSVLNRSFSGPNTVKYGPKKIRIRTFFMQCYVHVIWIWSNSWRSNLHIFKIGRSSSEKLKEQNLVQFKCSSSWSKVRWNSVL